MAQHHSALTAISLGGRELRFTAMTSNPEVANLASRPPEPAAFPMALALQCSTKTANPPEAPSKVGTPHAIHHRAQVQPLAPAVSGLQIALNSHPMGAALPGALSLAWAQAVMTMDVRLVHAA